MNKIILIGNVGNDAEQKEFENDVKVTNFSIGVSRWVKKEQKEVTDWFDIKTFNKVGDYIKKGLKVAVEGQLITNVYEKDGVNIKRVYVLANNVEILTPKAKEEKSEENIVEFDEEEIPF